MQNLAITLEESGATVTLDRLPIIRGNEIHMVRIFQNLIGNALKYRAERPLKISVHSERCGPSWVIRITDNGVGVAAENQERIFTPFMRVEYKGVPGNGLGLAVCKKIVEGHGGKIWVESTPSVAGSTFCFTIAAEQEESLVLLAPHAVV